MMSRLRRALPDLSDLLIVGGLTLATCGIARLSVPWAMILAGAVLLSLGLAIVLRRR